ncbi:hypothetical protein [Entomobacter blattae]|uniref:hypothetical protein n=1 Tax=Entomobacter blattae TaxID=2762277 RepID=UPI00193BCF3A|nr:hypothetical protein [Entomobacter blattae]
MPAPLTPIRERCAPAQFIVAQPNSSPSHSRGMTRADAFFCPSLCLSHPFLENDRMPVALTVRAISLIRS